MDVRFREREIRPQTALHCMRPCNPILKQSPCLFPPVVNRQIKGNASLVLWQADQKLQKKKRKPQSPGPFFNLGQVSQRFYRGILISPSSFISHPSFPPLRPHNCLSGLDSLRGGEDALYMSGQKLGNAWEIANLLVPVMKILFLCYTEVCGILPNRGETVGCFF